MLYWLATEIQSYAEPIKICLDHVAFSRKYRRMLRLDHSNKTPVTEQRYISELINNRRQQCHPNATEMHLQWNIRLD